MFRQQCAPSSSFMIADILLRNHESTPVDFEQKRSYQQTQNEQTGKPMSSSFAAAILWINSSPFSWCDTTNHYSPTPLTAGNNTDGSQWFNSISEEKVKRFLNQESNQGVPDSKPSALPTYNSIGPK